MGNPPYLTAITATALLVKATEKVIVGSSLTIFVSHSVESLPNFHHTQHFLVSCLTSYEVLSLTASHIALLCCNNLNPVTLLPSVTDELPHNCLPLIDHLVTPCNDL